MEPRVEPEIVPLMLVVGGRVKVGCFMVADGTEVVAVVMMRRRRRRRGRGYVVIHCGVNPSAEWVILVA